MKFFTVLETGERAYIQPEEDVEIVIGRDKVFEQECRFFQIVIPANRFSLSYLTIGQGDQNTLVNVFFSLGMGLALLIMGIDIDLEQVMEAVR